MTAIVVLGMHRSGTSCLAGMLAAGGVASAGEAIRNWDNARGHHEMLDVVRLNEAVLAHSGGHYLSAPAAVQWTDEHAALRDRLLAGTIDGRSVLLKDPRTLLVLPFWRASRVPFRAIGIVRHPLAVARSLEAWREMPLADGVVLWLAHNRALAADRVQHGYRIVDFEKPKSAVVAAVCELAPDIDIGAAADAYEEQLVHHDIGDPPAIAGLDDAVALYRELVAVRVDIGEIKAPVVAAVPDDIGELKQPMRRDNIGEIKAPVVAAERPDDIGEIKPPVGSTTASAGGQIRHLERAENQVAADAVRRHTDELGPKRDTPAGSMHESSGRRAFPRAEMAAFANTHDASAALVPARAALAAVADAAAVLVPIVMALVRRHAYGEARVLIVENAHRLDEGFADLLLGKLALASGDAASAACHLQVACAVPNPLFQARALLPKALRAAGKHEEARVALREVVGIALYPHRKLATLAEWNWLDGDRDGALAEMQRAIEAAPLHRRGRLRTRRAEWLLSRGDRDGARAELRHALDEDPAYGRARDVLATLA